ncbi:MAG: winged helix DNA-binding domain-containing protein [Anaerolineae bacterium]|nr:MAG: winged helix DNA-binding domain-containing protein [Anaerolineae bacterium]
MIFENISFRRLVSQRIGGEKFETPEAVVKWMGAIQAQDYMQSLWAIGLRTQARTVADVEQAIANRKIVRTWPMRGTIHFVPAEDAKWMLSLSASRIIAADSRRLRQLEFTVELMKRCQDLFCDALNGGRQRSRPEMMSLLEEAGIPTNGQRGYHILWYAAQSGVICLGPMQDKQQTFVLLDEWVPESRALSHEEALAELVGRFFASHGPATLHDFARWSGLTMADARLGLEFTKTNLVSEEIEGTVYWMAGDEAVSISNDGVYLLPGFDEYLLGYKDRSAVLAAQHAQKIVPGSNGIFLPMIVIAGQVVGTWKRSLRKKAIDITFNPFAPLGNLEERLVEAASAYSDFMGLPLSSAVIA